MSTSLYSFSITEIQKGSKKYPNSLLDLVDPPETLYVRGDISLLHSKNNLAVVGSRRMTHYGEDVTDSYVRNLSSRGLIITSGFMYGVDTVAHNAALSVSGKTIAVLGQGLNHVYPAENEGLYTEIIQRGGAIVSEYPLDFEPQNWTFPKRNRIIAAISLLGTLVIEATERSGSLITASFADALNRPLYAVPGPVTSITSKGVNILIKSGIAKMAMTPDDILGA